MHGKPEYFWPTEKHIYLLLWKEKTSFCWQRNRVLVKDLLQSNLRLRLQLMQVQNISYVDRRQCLICNALGIAELQFYIYRNYHHLASTVCLSFAIQKLNKSKSCSFSPSTLTTNPIHSLSRVQHSLDTGDNFWTHY